MWLCTRPNACFVLVFLVQMVLKKQNDLWTKRTNYSIRFMCREIYMYTFYFICIRYSHGDLYLKYIVWFSVNFRSLSKWNDFFPQTMLKPFHVFSPDYHIPLYQFMMNFCKINNENKTNARNFSHIFHFFQYLEHFRCLKLRQLLRRLNITIMMIND